MSSAAQDVWPFGTWNGLDSFELFSGVRLHAIGGDQVLLCRVSYDADKSVARHAHEHTEQVMVIVDGEVDVTIGDDRRHLRTGDVCVMNRGVEHELYSEGGVTFIEALAPVPLDHVPDRERDLVLREDGGSQHVER
jgi:quercetin dioxygenase-like cupin family protein